MGKKAKYFLLGQFLTALAGAAAVAFPPFAPFVPAVILGIEGATCVLMGTHAATDIKFSQYDPKKAGK